MPNNQDSTAAAGGINRQFHAQTYSPTLDKAQRDSQLSLANQWPSWYRGFKRYAISTGLFLKNNEVQVNNLTVAMGSCADEILTTLRVNEEEIDYKELIKKIEDFFNVRRNVLAERQKFNKRIQGKREDGKVVEETVEEFINGLYTLAETCEYGELKDEFIRDRIIAGVKDEHLSDSLVQQDSLTLERAVEMARKWEARESDLKQIRGETQSQIDFVGKKKPSNKDRPRKQQPRSDNQNSKCWFCAGNRHKRSECPARNAKCNKCGKIGHYGITCNGGKWKSKKVEEVEQTEEEVSEVFYLGEVNHKQLSSWEAEINTNGNPTTWKLDTGAEACVISDKLAWLKNQPLKHTKHQLRGPGGTNLPVIGAFEAALKYREKQITKSVFVVRNQQNSLLSKSACVELGLVKLTLHDTVEEVNKADTDFRAEFPQLFEGLGKIKTDPYKIKIKPDAKPFCLYTPRNIAHPLIPLVKKEIESMIKQDVIFEVTAPTEWCAGIVPVPKKNNKVRICVDLTHLNRAVEREAYPLKPVDYNLALLGTSKIFTKLDAASGFWQLPLHPDSQLLTTFITPFGRYGFKRLPFGISSAPEIFQRAMSQILVDIPGVICHMDDILIHSGDKADHDAKVRQVLKLLSDAGVTLNQKCEFSRSSIKFLGHIIDGSGVTADPDKTQAIRNFPAPQNITELQRFNGMVNQLGKFIPNLAEINLSLRQLLRKDQAWLWGPDQNAAFLKIKDELLKPQTLAHYHPSKETIIAADASNSGIGAVLLQIQEDGIRKPVCFASRSLSSAEQHYAVIEKEALAATWACEKFASYVTGMEFTVQTDHKPLVPLLSTKDLSAMPPRILRFRMRMMRFSPKIQYVQGKYQVTADALSRAPTSEPNEGDVALIAEVEEMASEIFNLIPASTQMLEQLSAAQDADEDCVEIKRLCRDGWPAFMDHAPSLNPYFKNREHLSLLKGLLIFDDRIVIPKCKRLEMLNKLHQGHLGITKCRARAKQSIWWPGLSSSIEEMVKNCSTCAKVRPTPKEPLMVSSYPQRPWERVGMDLFELQGKTYVIVVCYRSRWPEVRRLTQTTSAGVIQALKDIFSIHGIPDLVVSDNGPQFASQEFREFGVSYNFNHVTSSPHYPAANGEAERTVRTVKEMLKKNTDHYSALLTYRTTPLQNGLSPAELLMGRKLRTSLPMLPSKLASNIQKETVEEAERKETRYRDKQAENFNRRHRTSLLPQLRRGENVWIRDQERDGTVVEKTANPRSYLVETEKGIVRRNRSALVSTTSSTTSAENETHVLRRSTRQSKPPQRLIEEN